MAKTAKDAPAFFLPKSTLKVVVQILRTYGTRSGPMTVTEVARKLGSHFTAVSRNSKFFVNTGLIVGTKERSLTDMGWQLTRALSSDDEEQVRRGWRRFVDQTPFLQDCVNTLRIQSLVPTTKFLKYLVTASGETSNAHVRTGARTLTDILIQAGVVCEQDGSVSAVANTDSADGDADGEDESRVPLDGVPRSSASEQGSSVSEPTTIPTDPRSARQVDTKGALMSTVAINVELHVPATEDYGIYEKLFRALRVELLERDK